MRLNLFDTTFSDAQCRRLLNIKGILQKDNGYSIVSTVWNGDSSTSLRRIIPLQYSLCVSIEFCRTKILIDIFKILIDSFICVIRFIQFYLFFYFFIFHQDEGDPGSPQLPTLCISKKCWLFYYSTQSPFCYSFTEAR